MILKKSTNHNDTIEFEDHFMLKPAFRLFSRSIESSGWAVFFTSKPAAVYPKRAVIVEQGEENPNVFYILRGLVEYTNTSENGSENILEILGPGNMLNLQPVFGRNPSIATFKTLSECILTHANKNEILELMERDFSLSLEMFEEMAFIIGGLNRKMSMGAERSDVRTLRVIHMIATVHKRVYKEKDPIYIRLSQSDLARIVQTTRVTISKILSDMKRKGVLNTDYGGIYIKDTDLLAQLVKEKCLNKLSDPTP